MSERYLVLRKTENGQWDKTCWTDKNGFRPVYVGIARAKEALLQARTRYPDVKYKLSASSGTRRATHAD